MTPAEIVAALKAMGVSQRSIGAALGINDSYISQVRRGKKSGAHYADALAQLLEGAQAAKGTGAKPDVKAVPVTRPERRRTKSGSLARVRGAKYHAAGFTVELGPTACARGARSLVPAFHAALDAGLSTAFTLEFKPSYAGKITPENQSGKKKHKPKGLTGKSPKARKVEIPWVEFRTSDGESGVMTGLEDIIGLVDDGDTATGALVQYALDNTIISTSLGPGGIPDSAVSSIQMRAW